MEAPSGGLCRGTSPGRTGSVALGVFVAFQTLVALIRHDRPAVLFWWDGAAAPLVAILWIRNLTLAAGAGACAALLLRLSLRGAGAPPGAAPARRRALVGVFAAIVVAIVLRWVWPGLAPPGLWRDVVYSVRPALLTPEDVPILHGAFVGDDAPITAEVLSGPYLLFGSAVLSAFGRGDAGLLAVSALPGCLAVAGIALLAREIAGWPSAVVAAWLAATCRWPLTLSRFGATTSATVALVALATALVLRSLRTGSRSAAAGAGAAAGLALQTYAAAWIAVPGLVVAWWATARDRPQRKGAAIGTALVAAGALVYAWALHSAGGRLGGRVGEAGVWTPVKDVALAGAGSGPAGLAARIAFSTIQYTGVFLWTSDPVARHGLTDRPPFSPPIGLAALVGLALLAVRAADGERRLLVPLAVAAAALAGGILSNPTGAPNSMRVSVLMGPALAAAAIALHGAARRVRPGLAVGAVAAWCFCFESVPVLTDWPFRSETRQGYREGQTRAGRALHALAGGSAWLDPGVVRDPLVVETLAASHDGRVPVRRMPRLSPDGILRAAPRAPVWYVTDHAGAEALRAGGARVSRPVPMGNEEGDLVLVRLAPPR